MATPSPVRPSSEDQKEGQPFVERRKRPTPALSRYLFTGRRRGNRLPGSPQENYYVDLPPLTAWVHSLLLIGLSSCDAIFSLLIFSAGGYEANPVLAAFLRQGDTLFLLVKFAITLFFSFSILIHWKFFVRAPGVTFRLVARLGIALYGSLVAYEIYLLLG